MLNVRHVLCAVDFSGHSERAFAHAAALARWYEARLTALYVWSNIPAFDILPLIEYEPASRASLEASARAAIERELHAFCSRIASDIPMTVVVDEAPSIERDITAQVEALHADLLVIGSHGRSGFQHLLLGSVAEKVVRRASCPVMVVPARDATTAREVRFKTIVCAVDFSDGSLAALEYAFSLAEEADGRLILLHALELPPELHALPTPEGIDVDAVRAAARVEMLARLRALVPGTVRSFCTVETRVDDGKAYRAVLKHASAAQADVIVMGVSGHGAFDRWIFGSNTAGVMRAAQCPVLVVRSPM